MERGKMSDFTGAGRSIQAVDRAVDILRILAGQPEGMTLSELSERVGLKPQTAQSLVRTLQMHGWVAQPGRGRPYLLGPDFVGLADRWLRGHGPEGSIRGILHAFSVRLREYVLLAELRGASLIPLHEEQFEQPLMVRGEFGAGSIYAMATGKMLLASLPVATREAIVRELPLQARGPNAATSAEALLAQLAQIARQGYAVCRGENAAHICALAVVVRRPLCSPPVALGISLPEVRLTAEKEKELLRQLKTVSKEIETAWGVA